MARETARPLLCSPVTTRKHKEDSLYRRPDPDPPAPPLRLTVCFQERRREEVITNYCSDVMKGGMLIRTIRDPMIKLGTRVRLRFQLATGEEIFSGVGLVAWLQRATDHLCVGVHFEELSTLGEALYHDMLSRQLDRTGISSQAAGCGT